MTIVGVALFLVVGTIFVALLYWGLTHNVPIGSRGVVTHLGRRTGKEVREGVCLVLPPLVSVVDVDVRKREREVLIDGILTPEKETPMKMLIRYLFRITDASRWLDFDDPLKLVDSRISSAIRSFINDRHNPPRDYREVMEAKDKLLRIAIAGLKGYAIPKHENGEEKKEPEMKDDELARKREVEILAQRIKEEGAEFQLPEFDITIITIVIEDPILSPELLEEFEKITKEGIQFESETKNAVTKASELVAFMEKIGNPKDFAEKLNTLGITMPELLATFRATTGRTPETINRHVVDVLQIGELAEVIKRLRLVGAEQKGDA